eukprot:TRINITY_DN113080_c0_g1_i1.p1 TRINITY_DN113080_c0_g1~~TRINITY_DN113080_c0_g1_i1.p1  ORF type:complete len:394 (+),score=51.22 TRINITY_DN113080_c0_g1_i1:47-1183(+)
MALEDDAGYADRTERMARFMSAGQFADMSLLVGPEEHEIRVARVVLACASDVLEAMLSTCMQEGRAGAAVNIPDLDSFGMQAVVRYAYTGETDVEIDDLVSAFLAARKYEVRPLRDACIAKMKASSPEEALLILNAMATHADEELVEAADISFGDRFAAKAERAVSSDRFSSLSEAGLKLFVTLRCCKALTSNECKDLWDACKRWACSGKAAESPRQLGHVTVSLPVAGLPMAYLALLNEDGLLSASQITAAFRCAEEEFKHVTRNFHEVLSLIGSWKVSLSETSWFTVERDTQDGETVLWHSTQPSKAYHLRADSDGWYVATPPPSDDPWAPRDVKWRIKRRDNEMLCAVEDVWGGLRGESDDGPSWQQPFVCRKWR